MNRDGVTRDAALREARNVIEGRLQGLNELRREVTEDRGQLVQRQMFDVRMEGIEARFAVIEQWRNRAVGVITVLMVGSTALGAFVGWALAR
jgi:hypothetical protein